LFKKLHRFPARAAYKAQLTRWRVCLHDGGVQDSERTTVDVLRFYRPLLKNKYDDVQRRGAISNTCKRSQSVTRRRPSCSTISRSIRLKRFRTTRRVAAVVLSRSRRALGERSRVGQLFVIWMTDGWFPSSRFQDEFDDFDEERRLLYVATTRAKKELHFVYPAVDVYRGPETDGTPTLSRFLEPIPPRSSRTPSLRYNPCPICGPKL
jgi:DNA helicase-2/ATP-dependent DNA helicase PcrA